MGCGRAARSEPDSNHTGTISTTVRVRRAGQNAMKPRIQRVLTPWNPGFSASGRADWLVRQWTGQEAGRTAPMYMIWTGLLQPVEVFGR